MPLGAGIYSIHSFKKKKKEESKLKSNKKLAQDFFKIFPSWIQLSYRLVDTALLTTALLNFIGKSLFSCTKVSFSHKFFSATARNALHKYCTILKGVTLESPREISQMGCWPPFPHSGGEPTPLQCILQLVTQLIHSHSTQLSEGNGEPFWWHVGPRNSLGHVFLSAMGDGSNPFDFTAYRNTHGLSLVSLENILDSETNYVRPSCRVTSL